MTDDATTASSNFLVDLAWRGLLHTSTDLGALAEAMATGPLTLYSGYDPTAPSLHVGHLVPLLLMRRFQLAGHRPLALVGSATGLIGDPSGRSTERPLLDVDTVKDWVDRLGSQLSRFLSFESAPNPAQMVSNLDWTAPLSALEFLRDIGKHFSVNQMLAKDSVASRLGGEGLSFTEFSYQLLQAHDYLQLFRTYDCRLQIGGSDQWGNITAGLDLIRKVEGVRSGSVHAITVPLVTKSDGTKFGKSAGGALWLDPTMTSPYAWYQFWLNTDDRDVPGFLRLFSFKSRSEIEALDAEQAKRPAGRPGQHALAEELTTLVHGEHNLASATAASQALFGQGDLAALNEDVLAAALTEAGLVAVSKTASVAELMVTSGLAAGRGAARRTIAEGGAYLNNARIVDAELVPSTADLLRGRYLVLRRGRRTVAGVEVVASPADTDGAAPKQPVELR